DWPGRFPRRPPGAARDRPGRHPGALATAAHDRPPVRPLIARERGRTQRLPRRYRMLRALPLCLVAAAAVPLTEWKLHHPEAAQAELPTPQRARAFSIAARSEVTASGPQAPAIAPTAPSRSTTNGAGSCGREPSQRRAWT